MHTNIYLNVMLKLYVERLSFKNPNKGKLQVTGAFKVHSGNAS